MAINVAINGFGRIGRSILRALYESNNKEIKIVAINDVGDIKVSALLIKYDSVHGFFDKSVESNENELIIEGDKIPIYSDRDPTHLDWAKHNVDIVYECTGKFTKKEDAKVHIEVGGAKKVIISAPGQNADSTIVYGVNEDSIGSDDKIISNASCTTNCIAPVLKVLNESIGIDCGFLTTVHSFTNDQRLTDSNHKDPRRARSATESMIPTKTGAAIAVGDVIPDLKGKLDGYAIRIPIINVSVADLVLNVKKDTSVEEVNNIIKTACTNEMKNIIDYNELPLVSKDFNHRAASGIFDSTLTKVIDKRLVKIFTWYDNEWGFSNRMLDTTLVFMKK